MFKPFVLLLAILLCVSVVVADDDNGSTEIQEANAPVGDPYLIKFRVNLGQKKKGDVVIEVYPEWAPLAAERMKELMEENFFSSARFFRVLPGFMVQWGLPAKAEVAASWRNKIMRDEPVLKSNTRGYLSFAAAGKNSRTTQMFINYGDNSRLDSTGFTPFAKVIKGMDVVDSIYPEYREKPEQNMIQSNGNRYLKKIFPKLSYIEAAEFISERPTDLDPDDDVVAAESVVAEL